MKIIVKMENDKPILFFPDEPASKPNRVAAYAPHDGEHAEACRAYMRSLKTPRTMEERNKAWRVVAQYSRMQSA